MSQYTTGTITVTSASNVWTGVGTAFVSAGIAAGDMIIAEDDSSFFVVSAVNSELELETTANYGSNRAAITYQIIRDFTPNSGLPLANPGDRNFQQTYTDAMQKLDAQTAFYFTSTSYLILEDDKIVLYLDGIKIMDWGPDGITAYKEITEI